MGKVSRVSIPASDVDRVLNVVAPVRKDLAERLGITPMAIQMWRQRGVPATGSFVLVYMIHRTILAPIYSASFEEAVAPRLDWIRDKALQAGYNEERIDKVLADVAQQVRDGTPLPISRGTPFLEGEALRKALQDLGLSQQAFANKVGSTLRTVQQWVAGLNRIEGPISFYVRSRQAEEMKDTDDGVDPLTRAVADTAFDAMTYGWTPEDIVEAFTARGPALKV
jgi:transcriptional regulator with XRE-family HTH domain